MPVKIDLRTLNKPKPGRVEKPKSITYSGLLEALNLVKRLSSGTQAGSSGLQNKIRDPVVSKLLDFVKYIKQGGSTPTAVETSSAALAPGKSAWNKLRHANRAKRAAEAAQASSSIGIDMTSTGTLPPPPPPFAPSGEAPLPPSHSTSERVENEHLLQMTDEEIEASHHGNTPMNTSQDNSDLMDTAAAPVQPSQVESLADSVQQVAVQDQESEQRPSADP